MKKNHGAATLISFELQAWNRLKNWVIGGLLDSSKNKLTQNYSELLQKSVKLMYLKLNYLSKINKKDLVYLFITKRVSTYVFPNRIIDKLCILEWWQMNLTFQNWMLYERSSRMPKVVTLMWKSPKNIKLFSRNI